MLKMLFSVLSLLISISLFGQSEIHFVVAQDGSGDFQKIQDAIMAVPDFREKETVIYIKNGLYKEKLILPESKLKVTFLGEDALKTIITNDDFANKPNRFGEPYGTTGSSTFFIFGHDFSAKNITFQNTAGNVGQAVAVRITGDRAIFENCRFIGFQDTLYAHGENSRQYYKNCYIEGATDFIFGWSTAVFDACEIFSKEGGQYITAASTLEGRSYGFVFIQCKLSGDAPKGKVYLGRPWRIHAKTVFIQCEMGEHIRPEGWHNWNKPEAEATAFYAEFESSGPGANTAQRVSWAKQLSADEAKNYTISEILKGNDGWEPGKILENKLWPSPHHK
jgi:pectinesterase